MTPFLQTFFEEVRDNLGDPQLTKQLTNEKLLRDLYTADVQIAEALLRATGQESLFGYTEAAITLEEGRSFYPLPYGFRQYLGFEKRDSGGCPISRLHSRSLYSPDWGPEILSAQRGMRLRPGVTVTGDWVLRYLRGACKYLHYARTSEIKEKSIVAGEPAVDAGSLATVPTYYNGVLVKVYSADFGAPQVRVVEDYTVDSTSGRCVFHLRDAFSPLPRGSVWYEVCPSLPDDFYSLYALDVAITNLPRRDRSEKAKDLERARRRLWSACESHVTSNVADRGPARVNPLTAMDRMPVEVPVI